MSDDTSTENASQVSGDDGQQTKSVESDTLSKNDVARIVAGRVDKTNAKWEAKIPDLISAAIDEWRSERGLDDATLEKLDSADTQAVELRTHKIARTKAEKAFERLQSRYDMVHGKLSEALTRDAIYREAATKAVDPADVWLHLAPRLRLEEDLSVVVLGKDGVPTDSSITELVDNLLAEKKHLAKPSGAPGSGSRPSNGTAGGGAQIDRESLATSSAARIAYLQAHYPDE